MHKVIQIRSERRNRVIFLLWFRIIQKTISKLYSIVWMTRFFFVFYTWLVSGSGGCGSCILFGFLEEREREREIENHVGFYGKLGNVYHTQYTSILYHLQKHHVHDVQAHNMISAMTLHFSYMTPTRITAISNNTITSRQEPRSAKNKNTTMN